MPKDELDRWAYRHKRYQDTVAFERKREEKRAARREEKRLRSEEGESSEDEAGPSGSERSPPNAIHRPDDEGYTLPYTPTWASLPDDLRVADGMHQVIDLVGDSDE